MAVYTYRARDQKGVLVEGTINAESQALASKELRAEGKYVLDLTRGVQKVDDAKAEEIRSAAAARRVSRAEVIEFCHQISVMLESGVALGEALEAFNTMSQNSAFNRISRAVQDEVNSGASLSSAMARWPRVFPNITITLIEASEASGTMGMMLGRVAAYMSKEAKTSRQIRSALTYPIVMIFLSLSITLFLITVVLPRFATIYQGKQDVLPVPTKILLGLSNFVQGNWLFVALACISITGMLVMIPRLKSGRQGIDWLKLHMPIIGPMYRHLFITRIARTMSTLIVSGVNLLEAVQITRGITNNFYFRNLWDNVAFDLEQGQSLAKAIGQSQLIPPNVVRMIAAGEQTGRLGPVLDQIGTTSEEHLDEAVEKSTQFMEPAMIAIMGAVVGFVAIAMLLPIMTISRAVT